MNNKFKKNIRVLLSSIFIVGMIIIFTGCDNSLVTDNNLIFPDSLVSYQQHVYPFMKVKCAYVGCHGDSPQYGASRMDSYFDLFSIDNLGLIIANKPDQSKLNQVLENKLPHNPVFQSGYLTENQKKGMRRWVLEGAKNN
ncbi:MAG: hypothetical protein WCT77_08560 [Bacteroidota bacterium]